MVLGFVCVAGCGVLGWGFCWVGLGWLCCEWVVCRLFGFGVGGVCLVVIVCWFGFVCVFLSVFLGLGWG